MKTKKILAGKAQHRIARIDARIGVSDRGRGPWNADFATRLQEPVVLRHDFSAVSMAFLRGPAA